MAPTAAVGVYLLKFWDYNLHVEGCWSFSTNLLEIIPPSLHCLQWCLTLLPRKFLLWLTCQNSVWNSQQTYGSHKTHPKRFCFVKYPCTGNLSSSAKLNSTQSNSTWLNLIQLSSVQLNCTLKLIINEVSLSIRRIKM